MRTGRSGMNANQIVLRPPGRASSPRLALHAAEYAEVHASIWINLVDWNPRRQQASGRLHPITVTGRARLDLFRTHPAPALGVELATLMLLRETPAPACCRSTLCRCSDAAAGRPNRPSKKKKTAGNQVQTRIGGSRACRPSEMRVLLRNLVNSSSLR